MNRGQMEKVLVTGASGFLGSHICEVLHDAGYEVHALVRKTSNLQWLQHLWIHIHTADLFDSRVLENLFVDLDAVIHCAGALWGDYDRINVGGTQAVSRAALNAGIKRFVFVSSLAAGGPSRGPYPRNEGQSDSPISPYGYSKKRAEEYLETVQDKIDVVILRFPMIYGPRDAQALRLFKTYKYMINPSIGLRRRYISVVYVKDAARAAVKALQAPVKSGSIYNISDGKNYTFNRLYKVAGKVWGRKALRIPVPFDLIMFGARLINDVLNGKTAFNPEQMGMFRERFWLISPERAIAELGWRPETDIHQGFAQTVRWYKEHNWL
ncbi:NAD-dependent epimerase/dehydratase family protein [candidate division WOR-3 bacterium]|uniref:NAD-dependent epimerase/dehydratase family protein n=1 Tax=candidate division WOR-3 bacterium TaxID=2052148 RepID=A0A9D5KAZ0_UNCW3|nr:NAD-dependent epimerase/dehydratase family protein [candidate division WOR-3 bacterium]MBD3365375.1 NAD-dependent epimerase/dehydratase family protein [candidate division WOR-3 bacterium]